MDVIEKEICTGCLACVKLCPTNAIEIWEDEKGFKYPQIIEEKCIKCHKCRNLCITNHRKLENDKETLQILGVKSKNERERLTSRSGGIFSVLANHILSQKGIVYGCQLGRNLKVYHSRATTKAKAKDFKGSKYVKSDLKNVYAKAKTDLENGKKVLFSGTPCEIAGLYTFLKGTDKTNLYTCDIICHGTPTPLLYKEFIKFMEKEENEKLIHIDFRDKQFGWASHKETLTFKNKKISTEYYKDLFYSHYPLRPSCFHCQYSNMNRISDITIGDFWGIDKENKSFDDNKGVSLVLINTKKGERLFHRILSQIDYIAIDMHSQNYLQPNLQKPSQVPNNLEMFWKDYQEKGFAYIMKKYTNYQKNKKQS